MTDDRTPDPLDALDARGRAAAAGVRAAVAERPVPAFDPELVRIDVDGRLGATDRPRRRPIAGLLATAAAGVIVVAAVVALASNGDDDSAPTDRAPVVGSGRYVLGDPPAGYRLIGVFDASEPRAGAEAEGESYGPLDVYGPDVADPRLGVYVIADMTESDLGADSGLVAAADIEGRRAWRDTPDEDMIVVEVDGAFVAVHGAAAGAEVLAAAAEAVVVDGDRAEVPIDALPEGWRHVGQADPFDLWPGVVGMSTTDAGPLTWMAAYATPDGGYVTLSVSGGDAVRARVPLLAAHDVSVTDVGGHEAIVVRTSSAPEPASDVADTVSVTWTDGAGEVLQVASPTGLDEDTVLALARSIQAVTADDLPDLRRDVMEAQLAEPDVTVVARGTFPSGIEWALTEWGADSFLELLTTAPPGSTSSSGGAGTSVDGGFGEGTEPPPVDALDGYTTALQGDHRFVHGRLRLGVDVAAVEIRHPGTDEVLAEAEVVEGAGTRAWVAEVPDRSAYDVVALDSTGAEVDRLDIRTER